MKLSVAARQIYQGYARSPKKLKRNLFRWETRFNQLLMDWIMDMDYAKVPITKSQIETQCSIFMLQAQREFDRSHDEFQESENKVDWEEMLDVLSEVHFEWKSQTIPELRTLRVKVTMMVPVGNISQANLDILLQATNGTYLEDFETISCLVANIERKSPIGDSRKEGFEIYFESLVADRLRSLYEVIEDEKDPKTQERVNSFKAMGWFKKKCAEWSIVYV